jgi:hypothetical protein
MISPACRCTAVGPCLAIACTTSALGDQAVDPAAVGTHDERPDLLVAHPRGATSVRVAPLRRGDVVALAIEDLPTFIPHLLAFRTSWHAARPGRLTTGSGTRARQSPPITIVAARWIGGRLPWRVQVSLPPQRRRGDGRQVKGESSIASRRSHSARPVSPSRRAPRAAGAQAVAHLTADGRRLHESGPASASRCLATA